jgi:hypothetical protein
VLLVKVTDESQGMNVLPWFPGVFGHRVSLPSDQILQLSSLGCTPGVQNVIHFVLHFSFYDVRWGCREVGAMCHCFMIGGQQTGMEDIMNVFLSPLGREFKLINHWR